MTQLRLDYQRFIERNTEIIAIGPEDEKSFADWWHSNQMPFIGIADPKHVVADKYGQQVKLLKLGRMPALVVVDRQGSIRFRHYGQSMSDIPWDEDILRLLDHLNEEQK